MNKTSREIIDVVRRLTRDGGGDRWTDAEIIASVNMELSRWVGRAEFVVPYELTFVGAYAALPYWARYGVVQYLDESGENDLWVDQATFESDYMSTGAYAIELPQVESAKTYRIKAIVSNGSLPDADAETASDWDPDETTLDVTIDTTGVQPADCGWIKVGHEWIGYAGRTIESGSLVTLHNCRRSQGGTTASSSTEGDTVLFGIHMPVDSLLNVLVSGVTAWMHNMPISDASPQEREHHTWMMRYNEQQEERFWNRWTPINRGVKTKGTPSVILSEVDNNG